MECCQNHSDHPTMSPLLVWAGEVYKALDALGQVDAGIKCSAVVILSTGSSVRLRLAKF